MVYRREIENDNLAKSHRIEELEKEVEELKMKANTKREKRKTAEASHNTAKDKLAHVQQARIDEASAFRKKAKEVAGLYRNSLCRIGCDAELPSSYNAKTFLERMGD